MEWQDMASLLCQVTAGRGALHPRGSQECAHINKIHIPSSQVSPLAQIFSLSCLSPRAHILAAFTWLYSVRAPCLAGSAHPAPTNPILLRCGELSLLPAAGPAHPRDRHLLLAQVRTPQGTMPERCLGAEGCQQQRGCAQRSWGSGTCSREGSSAAFAEGLGCFEQKRA